MRQTFLLFRDAPGLGKLYTNGQRICHTSEDAAALPLGRYPLTLSFSHRFEDHLPAIRNGGEFQDAWMYGGERAPDTAGSIFVGRIRTIAGVQPCPDTIRQIISLIQDAEDRGDEVWLEIV